MNLYLVSIIVLLILFVLYCHYYSFKKINPNWEILQVENPSKDKYEKVMLQKLPTVITNVIKHWDGINQINPNYIHQTKNKYPEDKNVKKLLDKYLGFYHLQFTIRKSYISYYGRVGSQTPIILQKNHRHLMCQLYGKRRIIIFMPEQDEFLYPTNSSNDQNKKKSKKALVKSKVDFWNQDLETYPKFNNARYLEIILSQGQILYIPYGWWWASECITESITLNDNSVSVLSIF